MPETTRDEDAPRTARIFMHGRSQAVRLPKAFRLPGDRVRVRRIGKAVILEPDEAPSREDIRAVFAEIDSIGGDFLPEGRPEQPPMPPGPDFP